MIKVIVLILLFLALLKQFSMLRKCKIHAIQTVMNNVVFSIGSVVLVIITYLYGKSVIDYGFAVIGEMLWCCMFFKEGISSEGLIVYERGKEFYSWSEIEYVTMNAKTQFEVRYYLSQGQMISKQKYPQRKQEEVKKLLYGCVDIR